MGRIKSNSMEFFEQLKKKLDTKESSNSVNSLECFKNAFLSFEELENKSLYSLLNIIRKELGYDQTIKNALDAKKIRELNKIFEDLIETRDAEEYVRKVSMIWYRFMLLNPYTNNNEITNRLLLTILLAHRDFIITPMFKSREERINFINYLNDYENKGANLDVIGSVILDKLRKEVVDLTGKNRLSKKNSRQSDIWAVNKNPSDADYALQTILERKKRITQPIKIFTNCSSKFIINGREIERYIGTVIFSKEIDLSFCIMNNGNNGYAIENVVEVLNENDVPYEVIAGDDIADKKDDENIPETWFIRELYVLIESLNNSRDNGCEECIVYPDVKSRLMVGYYTDDNKFHEVWGLHFKGLITTNNSWSLLINEKDYRNISVEEAIKTIEKEGFSYTIGNDPFEEVKKK